MSLWSPLWIQGMKKCVSFIAVKSLSNYGKQRTHCLFYNFLISYWSIAINNVVTVLGGWQRGSTIHICVSILPQTPPTSRLPHNSEQTCLCQPPMCFKAISHTHTHTHTAPKTLLSLLCQSVWTINSRAIKRNNEVELRDEQLSIPTS